MTQECTFTTTYMWHNSVGSECECAVEVVYTFQRGKPDSVEVVSVTPVDSEYEIGAVDLDAFADECAEHAAALAGSNA